jgi:hypothetical protein
MLTASIEALGFAQILAGPETGLASAAGRSYAVPDRQLTGAAILGTTAAPRIRLGGAHDRCCHGLSSV